MTESEFNQHIDTTLTSIEEKLDDAETDLDSLISGGVLTIICENKSQLILTRQTPVKQLWLATKTGGFHFDYDEQLGGWIRDSDGTAFKAFFEREFLAQAGEKLSFDV